MNKTVSINISKNGFFLGNERLNMLEYQFVEIRLRNHFYIVESDTSPGANCVICYDFKPERMPYFSELDVWFTCDNRPLSENDYKKLTTEFLFQLSMGGGASPVVRDELSSLEVFSSVAQIEVPAGIDTTIKRIKWEIIL